MENKKSNMVKSQLLDMRDCYMEKFKEIYKEMLEISLLQQPKYFLPLLIRSHCLQGFIVYNPWPMTWNIPACLSQLLIYPNSLFIFWMFGKEDLLSQKFKL